MLKNRILTCVIAAALGTVAAAPAGAATAITGFVGGSLASNPASDLPRTVGWSFAPTANLTVTALGFFDVGGDGLSGSHQLGIWRDDGTLLGSATIAAGTSAALDGGFRYVDSADFALLAGSTYVIGASIASDGDTYFFSPSSVSADASIGYIGGLRGAENVAFMMPDRDPISGRLGPNFQFALASVPEPGTWGMMISGFGLIGASLRSRRKAQLLAA